LSVPAVENSKGPKDQVIDDVVVPIPREAAPEKTPCEHDPVKVEKDRPDGDYGMLPYPADHQNKYANITKTEVNPVPRPPKYGSNYEAPSVGIPNSI